MLVADILKWLSCRQSKKKPFCKSLLFQKISWNGGGVDLSSLAIPVHSRFSVVLEYKDLLRINIRVPCP